MTEMRTKRRYAHELYPHPPEDALPPLAEVVPYLYARALGFGVQGTSWLDEKGLPSSAGHGRLEHMIAAGQRALLADALLQGLAGQEAWDWAEQRCHGDNLGEWQWERAVHYGVDPDAIKPYLCGPEPDHHDHLGPPKPGPMGWRTVTTVQGRESDCPDCCEPAPTSSTTLHVTLADAPRDVLVALVDFAGPLTLDEIVKSVSSPRDGDHPRETVAAALSTLIEGGWVRRGTQAENDTAGQGVLATYVADVAGVKAVDDARAKQQPNGGDGS